MAGYGGFVWYPVKAAGDLMRPASQEFVGARDSYRAVVDAFPAVPELQTLNEGLTATLAATQPAREALSEAQTALDARDTVDIPVVRSRPALKRALELRERMVDFYIGALELVADIEGDARYLTSLLQVLPRVPALRSALGTPKTPKEVDQVLGAARPIADQLVADVEALSAPAELGSTHEAARAIASGIRTALDELDGVTGRTARPIIETLVAEIGEQLTDLEETVLGAPQASRDATLGPRIAEFDKQATRVANGLRRLRDDHGIEGLTIP